MLLAELCLLFILGFTYCHGVLAVARKGIIWEAMISVLYPFCCCFIKSPDQLVSRLVITESLFNMLCLLIKIVHTLHLKELTSKMRPLFIGWCCIQLGGFIVARAYKGMSLTLFPHLLMAGMFFFILRKHNVPTVDTQGRINMVAEESAWMMPVAYAFWFINAHFVDKEDSFPHLAFSVLQSSSILVAAYSGEFWHARLLTASHLIISRHTFEEFIKFPDNFATLNIDGMVYLKESLSVISALGILLVFSYWMLRDGRDK